MLGFGTKKAARLDRFPTESWAVAQCECEGLPMVVRVNTGAGKFVAHPELPTRLGVTVAFNSPNENGFCTPEEGAEIGEIEDRLCDRLQPEQAGFLVLVITTGGRREFVFYVRDAEGATEAVEAVRAGVADHRLEYGTEQDPEWAYYARFG